MGNAGNTLEQLKRETKDDAKLCECLQELHVQGVPFEELKALIPDLKRTREQLRLKRMLENNNEVLISMFSKEMSFLLDAKERQEEEQFKKLDQLGWRTWYNPQARQDERSPPGRFSVWR